MSKVKGHLFDCIDFLKTLKGFKNDISSFKVFDIPTDEELEIASYMIRHKKSPEITKKNIEKICNGILKEDGFLSSKLYVTLCNLCNK